MRLRVTPTRAIALAIGAALSLCVAVQAADRLDSYRELTRGPARAGLLRVARTEAERSHAPEAPRDSIPRTFGFALPPAPAALYLILQRGNVTRACLGHEPPHSTDLAEAVRALAAEVCTGDRRRQPVRAEELNGLRVILGLAGNAEPVARPTDIDPGREGLLIVTDQGRVAFLPGEARTIAWALREARRIGVLTGPAWDAHFYRFDVVTMSDVAPQPAPRRNRRDAD